MAQSGPPFQNLLNAGNNCNEGGNLLFEIICKHPVTQADAKAACSNYQNKVNPPPVGSHVRIVGVYVQDTFHAQWIEIHPVTSIVVECAVASAQLHFSGEPASSRQFNCRPPANYFGPAGALRKLTRSPRSVAFRVGQGIPNS